MSSGKLGSRSLSSFNGEVRNLEKQTADGTYPVLSVNRTTYYHQEKPEHYYACQKAVDFSRSYANNFSSDPCMENEWQMKEKGKDKTD